MASIGLQIVLAIQTLLTVPEMSTVAADAVHIDPIFPADLEAGTALNVELGDEVPPTRLVLGTLDRDAEIKLTFMAAGPTAIVEVDALMVEGHARLMADATLGGLCFDISESGTTRQNVANGQRLAVIEKTYLVNFRTSETALDA